MGYNADFDREKGNELHKGVKEIVRLPITTTHPSLKWISQERIDDPEKTYGERLTKTLFLKNKTIVNVSLESIQKHTRDVAKIKQVLTKHLTSEYEGQVAVILEYYKILKDLELEE